MFFTQAEDVYFFALALLAPVLGILTFLTLLRHHGLAHLCSLRDALVFFFAPFGPNIMLVIKRFDGKVAVLYDKDIEYYDLLFSFELCQKRRESCINSENSASLLFSFELCKYG